MPGKIFSLFLFISDGVIWDVGAMDHEFEGTEEEMTRYLLENAEIDAPRCAHHALPSRYKMTDGEGKECTGIPLEDWGEIMENRRYLEVFEEVFSQYGILPTSFFCMIPVFDGVPQIGSQEEESRESTLEDESASVTRWVRENAAEVSTFALNGFQEQGRGAVIIEVGEMGKLSITYRSETQIKEDGFTDDLQRWVSFYEPTEHAVLCYAWPEGFEQPTMMKLQISP